MEIPLPTLIQGSSKQTQIHSKSENCYLKILDFICAKLSMDFGSVEVGINLIVLGEYSPLHGIVIGKDVNCPSIESTFFAVSSLSFQLL